MSIPLCVKENDIGEKRRVKETRVSDTYILVDTVGMAMPFCVNTIFCRPGMLKILGNTHIDKVVYLKHTRQEDLYIFFWSLIANTRAHTHIDTHTHTHTHTHLHTTPLR